MVLNRDLPFSANRIVLVEIRRFHQQLGIGHPLGSSWGYANYRRQPETCKITSNENDDEHHQSKVT